MVVVSYVPEGMLLAVECNKLGAFRLGAHNNLVTLNHVGVEAVHRLAVCHHYVVGNIDNIVDRTQADNLELVLQPLGALLNLTTSDADASITLASLGILYLYVDRKVGIVDCKL